MNWLDEELAKNPQPRPPAIPERYRGASLAGIPKDHPLRDLTFRYLVEFYDHAARGVAPLLLGPTGHWKTYAAAAVANGVGSVVETEFVSVPDEFTLLVADRFSADTRERLARLMSVPFLVLDDLFWIRRDSWEAQTLVAVLAARFNGLRPTLITGNLELPPGREFDTLAASWGPLVARRLRDAAGEFCALLDVGQIPPSGV